MKSKEEILEESIKLYRTAQYSVKQIVKITTIGESTLHRKIPELIPADELEKIKAKLKILYTLNHSGENAPNAKLVNSDIEEIKTKYDTLLANGTKATLAQEEVGSGYNVKPRTIRKIIAK